MQQPSSRIVVCAYPARILIFGPHGCDAKVEAWTVKISSWFWVSSLVCIVNIGTASAAWAQNRIAVAGWQGFAVRDSENKFDSCVLYNRTIEKLTISPYEMLGISRAANGDVGLLVFFTPGALTRESDVPVNLKVDGHPLPPLSGIAKSDFHVSVAGPLGPDELAALRGSKEIEATAENKTITFSVVDVGAVLDTLDECVKRYARER